ncbi:MAG: hypothetical protein V4713_07355 [Pseudomonadota bacterium]
MDITSFLTTLVSTGNPVLPGPLAMQLALHLVWAVVLGAAVWRLTGKLSRTYRLGLSGLLVLWTLVPGSASPAYWLGLAFQTPSLTSGLICLIWLLNQLRRMPGAPVPVGSALMGAWNKLAGLGIVLGWVLLLDTLAWLPVSVYAWGFSSAAFSVLTLLSVLVWVLWGSAGASRGAGLFGPILVLGVLALFVFTRLPTGNVWDALIDPWLWAGLQVSWLVSVVRRLKSARCAPAAIRA